MRTFSMPRYAAAGLTLLAAAGVSVVALLIVRRLPRAATKALDVHLAVFVTTPCML